MLLPQLLAFALRSAVVLGAALVFRFLLRSRLRAADRYRLVFFALAFLPVLLMLSLLKTAPESGHAPGDRFGAGPARFLEETVSFRAGGSPAESTIRIPEPAADLLVGAWAAGCLLLLAKGAAARFSSDRTLKKLLPCRDPRWGRALERARELLGVRRPVALLDGGDLPPFASDFSGGAVVVPSAGDSRSEGDRLGILLHELAHLKRGDLRRMAWMETVAATLWFLPLAWIALRALDEDREEDCDALVVEHGAAPADYAALLLEFATRRPQLPARARAMAGPARIERRILAILGGTRRSSVDPFAAGAAGLALAAAIFGSGWTAGAVSLLAVEPPGTVLLSSIDSGGISSTKLALSVLPIGSPVEGSWKVSQRFGPQERPGSGAPYLHAGIDLTDGRSGGSVRSTLAGTVSEAGYDPSRGNYVIVERGATAVVFAKLQRIRVGRGQSVSVGTEIGAVGSTGISTGPHLHYEVHVGGAVVDPAPLLEIGGARFPGL